MVMFLFSFGVMVSLVYSHVRMYQGTHFTWCSFFNYTSTKLFDKEILTQALLHPRLKSPWAGYLLSGMEEWCHHGDGTRSCSEVTAPGPAPASPTETPGHRAIRYCDTELCPEVFHKTQPCLVLPVLKGWCGPARLSALHFFFLTDKEMEPEGTRLINFHNVTSESGQKQD